MEKEYDFIISGGGCAGLSLACRLVDQFGSSKSILIIDKDSKNKNDRTWSFWEKGRNYFESILYTKWNNINFYSNGFSKTSPIAPYAYKMIRGIDFYEFCHNKLKLVDSVDFVLDEIKSFETIENKAVLEGSKSIYKAEYCFNSILTESIDKSKCNYLDQHFKGWIIETKTPSFDSDTATFMDFRIDQEGEARFLYVLPHSETKALVEVAIFSNNILKDEEYNKILADYIADYLELKDYKIEEEEFGVIPMTDYKFKSNHGKAIINIGTAAGHVKPSSGYAFKRIQEYCDSILNLLKQDKYPSPSIKSKRHLWLDGIMLNVMVNNRYPSAEIFANLFKKYDPQVIFEFLDEESNLMGDLKIISAPPKIPFIKAMIDQIIGGRTKLIF